MNKVTFAVSGESTNSRAQAASLARKAIEGGKAVVVIHVCGDTAQGCTYAAVYLHSDGHVCVMVPDGSSVVDLRDVFTLDTALRVAHGWILAD